ncbi:hypothetical protein D1AOALGA4SA_8371 [Olavius algarvensis Delta 1 endosymbiont]|nr:hypothetical protein D1AOALGA4SA_8371 [Olavius algarvensis Delta 1 endosymbiont]
MINIIQKNIETGKLRIFSQYPNMRAFFLSITQINWFLRKMAQYGKKCLYLKMY